MAIFTHGEITDLQIKPDDITTHPNYPTDITDGEQRAGYEPIVLDNPDRHLPNASPYIHGVGKELDAQSLKIKGENPDGQIRYTSRDRQTGRPLGDSEFSP